ncbi:LytR/AlgR family response regulator transcription factor [Neolewinella agarilytica]|uniref:Two component transcriptional regulator, LytTR family n=1 Tax=Neolewinella agarilytica TaxID=478744 RepID=A0A1H9CBS0_9BACT|nr:response regulator [Neolewinella agarilytica]SEP98589.1 two component transcriptional regulator, LytTR family [Neolewinella agarilytica]
MTILIVEDEPLYATHLEMLAEDLGHEVLGCAVDADSALEMVKDSFPDLLLMDINIPGAYDGVETAERIQQLGPCSVIFITAEKDDRTFQRASRTGPVNFLLKPFDDLQVSRAIQLASGSPTTAANASVPKKTTEEEENLYVKTGKNLRKIPLSEITSVNADGRYCEIHTTTNRYLIRMPLQELEGRLPADRFMRTHRSHLVNEQFVESVDLQDSEIVLIGGRRVPLAKREREEFLRRIGKL